MKSKNKTKKIKPRIPVAPPSKRHKSVKDYDRKNLKKEDRKASRKISSNKALKKPILDETEETEKSEYWFDYFFEIFGLKRV